MNIEKLTMIEIANKIKNREVTSKQVVQTYMERIKQFAHKNAVIEVFESAIKNAEIVDKKIEAGMKVGKLAGVPIIIKDNILYENHKASCASKFMEDFVSPYTSTVVSKLLQEDAIVLARANMDEFAMGSTNETSAFGACKNAIDDKYVSGGSSGGSAVSVALSLASSALGTDTGGSVRQPASFNGVVGMKPTYGRVSRYGVVAYASSFDQVGPITKTVKDNALLLSILSGQDENDQTSKFVTLPNYLENLNADVKGLKIGLIKEVQKRIVGGEHEQNMLTLTNLLKEKGAEIVEVDILNWDIILPTYYILANAEAASNLGRFDGVKYTKRSSEAVNIDDVYRKSRSEGFGAEVKRRIMMGNFVLSSANYEAYYKKAKQAQLMLAEQMNKVFNDCDAILLPTTIGEAIKLNTKTENLTEIYLQDIFTTLANITEVPALSVPYAKGKNGLPLGIQLLSKQFNEQVLYNIGQAIEADFYEVKV